MTLEELFDTDPESRCGCGHFEGSHEVGFLGTCLWCDCRRFGPAQADREAA